MGLYKLEYIDDINSGKLIEATRNDIDYENTFENWLESSPYIIYDGDETVFWLTRQGYALVGDSVKRPDLIGLNSEGDIVVCELKKGKAPREVISQILEYCTWASKLKYNDLNLLYQDYKKDLNLSLVDEFCLYFDHDKQEFNINMFNCKQELLICAEDFSKQIIEVTEFLNYQYHLPLRLMKYDVHKTDDNSYFINTELIGNDTNNPSSSNLTSVKNYDRWSEDIKIKDLVKINVEEYLNETSKSSFKPKDIIERISNKYPQVNKSTIRCQIIADCVNHNSRKHYPSAQRDLYFLVSKGNYRLYLQTDGNFDYEGNKIE